MICIFCGIEQQTGEIFANGMHLACHAQQRKAEEEIKRAMAHFDQILSMIHGAVWGKAPDKLVEDVLKSPEVFEAEKIIGRGGKNV